MKPRTWFWLHVGLALTILLPALYGFGTKFRELLLLYGGQVESTEESSGAFALMPILNYVLVSFGFLLMFCGAVLHGMFRDVEGPKYTMLETENLIDALAARGERPAPRD